MPIKSTEQLIFHVHHPHLLDVALRDFLLDVQAANCSPRTVEFYKDVLQPFLDYLKAQNAQTIEPVHIRGFLSEMAKSHSPGGCHAYWRGICAFIRFLVREDILKHNPNVSGIVQWHFFI